MNLVNTSGGMELKLEFKIFRYFIDSSNIYFFVRIFYLRHLQCDITVLQYHLKCSIRHLTQVTLQPFSKEHWVGRNFSVGIEPVCGNPNHHHSSTCVERTDLTTPLQVPRSCIAIPSSFLAMWESLASTSGNDNLLLLLPFGLGFHSTKEETTSFVAR